MDTLNSGGIFASANSRKSGAKELMGVPHRPKKGTVMNPTVTAVSDVVVFWQGGKLVNRLLETSGGNLKHP